MQCDDEVARHGTFMSLEKVTKLFSHEKIMAFSLKNHAGSGFWLTISPAQGKLRNLRIHPGERGACLTSRGQSAAPWLRIRILGAGSPSCSLHSRDCNYIPLLGIQIVVLGARCPLPSHGQGLQLLPPTPVDTAENSQAKGV